MTVSKFEPSASVPEPRAIARSMLSFGIEYDLAFSIAFWSARFAAGSPPPSFAATMIARDSFENSFPRFASAAPFLCLIDDHLLCPDTRRLLDSLQEQLVHPRIFCQLGVERRDDEPPVADEHRFAVVLGEHLDVRADRPHAGRPDENAAQRHVVTGEIEVGFEARDLSAVCVPFDVDVDEREVVPVEDDHPRTRTEHRRAKGAERFVEPVEPHQTLEGRRLAARNDETIEAFELLRLAHLDDVGAETAEHRRVLAKISLNCQDADLHRVDASQRAPRRACSRRVQTSARASARPRAQAGTCLSGMRARPALRA